MDVFLGQLLLVGFDYAPLNWAPAAGQLLPIARYTALFSLLGINYGGNGISTFQLPNLQGACAIGYGSAPGLSTYEIGQSGGSAAVKLTEMELPNHNHSIMTKPLPTSQTNPKGHILGEPIGAANLYSNTTSPPQPMAPGALGPPVGGSMPHDNMMPFLALNWIIALDGIFPQRS